MQSETGNIPNPRHENQHETNQHTNTLTMTTTTDDTRDIREIKHSSDEVRYFSADGALAAYRDGDEHVIVSNGQEPRDKWTKRVPAERETVEKHERLWTIPSNWNARAVINAGGMAKYRIYSIPETGFDVLVLTPHKCRLVDAYYSVSKIGEMTVTYADSVNTDPLNNIIDNSKEIEEVPDIEVNKLKKFKQNCDEFERKLESVVNEFAKQAIFGDRFVHEPVGFDGWTTDPWKDTFEIEYIMGDVIDVDVPENRELCSKIIRTLQYESDVIPAYPKVEIDVEEKSEA